MLSGVAMASKVRFAQPNQLASSSSPRTLTSSKRAVRANSCQLLGREGVDVDEGLERVVVVVVAVAVAVVVLAGCARMIGRHSGDSAEAPRLG